MPISIRYTCGCDFKYYMIYQFLDNQNDGIFVLDKIKDYSLCKTHRIFIRDTLKQELDSQSNFVSGMIEEKGPQH